MRIVFLGSPEFAVPSLVELQSAGHHIAAVFTQPDRPKGRSQQLTESPVKIAARRANLPVYQPERIRRPENVELLKSLSPELMVVVGYGQIIPQSIIDIPKHGILNVHASLLPKYRGAAPIQWAIASGETQTGITIMQIDAGLDTGDMLAKTSVDIGPDETAPEVAARLAPIGARLLVEVIDQITEGNPQEGKQNAAEATHAPILKREDGLINWSWTAQQIYNRLRGFTPWPGVYTTFRGQQLLILRARVAEQLHLSPYTLHVEKRRLFVGCGNDTALELLEVQLASKKRVSAEAFLHGHKLSENERIGD